MAYNNPFMNTLQQGGSVANQSASVGSQFMNNALNAFNSAGSLSMKMISLLEQEEARKQQQLLQQTQLMHNIYQDAINTQLKQQQLQNQQEYQDKAIKISEINTRNNALNNGGSYIDETGNIKTIPFEESNKYKLALINNKADLEKELIKQRNNPNVWKKVSYDTTKVINGITVPIKKEILINTLTGEKIDPITNQRLSTEPTNVKRQITDNTSIFNQQQRTLGSLNENNNNKIFDIKNINGTQVKVVDKYGLFTKKGMNWIPNYQQISTALNDPQSRDKTALVVLNHLIDNIKTDSFTPENIYTVSLNKFNELFSSINIDDNTKQKLFDLYLPEVASKIWENNQLSFDKKLSAISNIYNNSLNRPLVQDKIIKETGLTDETLKILSDKDRMTQFALYMSNTGLFGNLFKGAEKSFLGHMDIDGVNFKNDDQVYKAIKITLPTTVKILTNKYGVNQQRIDNILNGTYYNNELIASLDLLKNSFVNTKKFSGNFVYSLIDNNKDLKYYMLEDFIKNNKISNRDIRFYGLPKSIDEFNKNKYKYSERLMQYIKQKNIKLNKSSLVKPIMEQLDKLAKTQRIDGTVYIKVNFNGKEIKIPVTDDIVNDYVLYDKFMPTFDYEFRNVNPQFLNKGK